MLKISSGLLDIIAKSIAQCETHLSLQSLFKRSVPFDLEPFSGSKLDICHDYLRQITNHSGIDSLNVLSKLIARYIENIDEENVLIEETKQKLLMAIKKSNLSLDNNGFLFPNNTGQLSSSELLKSIKDLDAKSIEIEFDRALNNVEKNPREAVSAASNILESLFKVYIEDNNLEMPKNKDIMSLWAKVKVDLNFDPKKLEDDDLKKIISGLVSIVDGIGSLRTHASSAHGQGKTIYKLESRHSKLAVLASHTLATFIVESSKK